MKVAAAPKQLKMGNKNAKSPAAKYPPLDSTEMRLPRFTLAECAKHNTKTDLYVVVKGRVYNASGFEDHPGGISIIVASAGRDSTEDFEDSGHSPEALAKMATMKIGVLQEFADYALNHR